MPRKAGLTPKQAAFAQEYLVDLNATQAALRAGYSPRNPDVVSGQLLGKTCVQQEIARLRDARNNRTDLKADEVVRELYRVAMSDTRKLYNPDGTLKPPHEWDDETAASVAGLDIEEETTADPKGGKPSVTTRVKRVKRWDKRASLVDLLRHMGIDAPDKPRKVELTGGGGGPVRVATLTPEELRQLSVEQLRAIADGPSGGGPA